MNLLKNYKKPEKFVIEKVDLKNVKLPSFKKKSGDGPKVRPIQAIAVVCVLACVVLSLVMFNRMMDTRETVSREAASNQVRMTSIRQYLDELENYVPELDEYADNLSALAEAGNAVAGYQNTFFRLNINDKNGYSNNMRAMNAYLAEDSADQAISWFVASGDTSKLSWSFVMPRNYAGYELPALWVCRSTSGTYSSYIVEYVTATYLVDEGKFSGITIRTTNIGKSVYMGVEGNSYEDGYIPVESPDELFELPEGLHYGDDGLIYNEDGTLWGIGDIGGSDTTPDPVSPPSQEFDLPSWLHYGDDGFIYYEDGAVWDGAGYDEETGWAETMPEHVAGNGSGGSTMFEELEEAIRHRQELLGQNGDGSDDVGGGVTDEPVVEGGDEG